LKPFRLPVGVVKLLTENNKIVDSSQMKNENNLMFRIDPKKIRS
jgi:hypothetical protein